MSNEQIEPINPYDDLWGQTLCRPITPETYELVTTSGLFDAPVNRLNPSVNGLKVLLALAQWSARTETPAPRHTELEFIYNSGFNEALFAVCCALTGKSADELSDYFVDDHHLKMLKLFGGGQCVVNELLRELGIKVHPEAEDRRSA